MARQLLSSSRRSSAVESSATIGTLTWLLGGRRSSTSATMPVRPTAMSSWLSGMAPPPLPLACVMGQPIGGFWPGQYRRKRMARIERDGVGIHYEVNGTGPAVLLSHGYSATCRMWDGQLAALSASWRVITWDMLGHGQSDSPDDQGLYSEAHSIADMAAVLRACGET